MIKRASAGNRCPGAGFLVLLSVLLQQACTDTVALDKPSAAPSPPGFATPAPGEEAFSLIQQNGTLYMNQEGQKVSLRGINLGNWLAMEIWMFSQTESPLGEGIIDQCTLEEALVRNHGVEEKERLLNVFRHSWMVPEDWDILKEAGFNLIRVPFLYDMIEDDNNPMTVRGTVAADQPAPPPAEGETLRDNLDNAWRYLDWAVDEAKKRNMYIILDLHGAAGRQGTEHHSGCSHQNLLWPPSDYQGDGSQYYQVKGDTPDLAELRRLGTAMRDRREVLEPGAPELVELRRRIVEVAGRLSRGYQERTKWLWRQIATRYRDEDAVAAYGLLNEPWGTDSETLRDFMIELVREVRTIDNRHLIFLHGHNDDGIEAYGDPTKDYGVENVAFEIHAYPGLFGQGSIGYEAHRDWLTCGANGTSGVCDVARQSRNSFTPVFVGETQTWTGLGPMGGDITRATYDRYNQLNWAVTGWSYKTTSFSGGLGSGPWGLLTNEGFQLLTKADTWGCDDWSDTFAEACSAKPRSAVPYVVDPEEEAAGPLPATQTHYLVIKTGSRRNVDVVYDEIRLVDEADGTDLLGGAGLFGPATASMWTQAAIGDSPGNYDYNHQAGEFAGSDTGPALRVSVAASSNSYIYRTVEVGKNRSYRISGKFMENGREDPHDETWAEIYLIPELPPAGRDVTGRVLPPSDLNEASAAEVEEFFSSFADPKKVQFIRNHWVFDSLNSPTPSELFADIPAPPTGLSLTAGSSGGAVALPDQVSLAWNHSPEAITGYRVYRSVSPRTGFSRIGTLPAGTTTFTDSQVPIDATHYYRVAAYDALDESYPSSVVGTSSTVYPIPGMIEAEGFNDSHPGVVTEGASDIGGGFNVGHFEPGRWVEYQVENPTAGEYDMEFRVASLVGDVSFEVLANGEVLDLTIGEDENTMITVPNTGSWQVYVTLAARVTLPEGRLKFRLRSVDNQWNLNWFRFSAAGSSGGGGGQAQTATARLPLVLANPLADAITAGTGAGASIIASSRINKDVVLLTVPAGGDAGAGSVGFTFESRDISGLNDTLEFDVYDVSGSGVFAVTLTDATGAQWSATTPDADGGRSKQGDWVSVSLDISTAGQSIDLTQLTGIGVGSDRSGAFLFSDFSFFRTGTALADPTSVSAGNMSTATLVRNDAKAKDVVSLTVTATDRVNENYAFFNFAERDISDYGLLRFDVLDGQGANTMHVTLVDANGAGWSAWTPDFIDYSGSGQQLDNKSSLEEWRTVGLPIHAAATFIDVTRLAGIRVAAFHPSTYLFSDFVLFMSPAPAVASPVEFVAPNHRLPLPNPLAAALSSGSAATTSVVNNAAKNRDVISLVVSAAGDAQQGSASFSFTATDAGFFNDVLEFDVLDMAGSNRFMVTLTDSDGGRWSAATPDTAAGKSVQNEWATVSLDISAASINPSKLNGIGVGVASAGTFLLSDFVLSQTGTVIANPTGSAGVSSGTMAAATAVNNAARGGRVIVLNKQSVDNVDEGYAAFSFTPVDISAHGRLRFSVLDPIGPNTVHITLIDGDGNSWSAWTPEKIDYFGDGGAERENRSANNSNVALAAEHRWAVVSLDIVPGAAVIDFTRLSGIRVAEYHPASYLFSDFVFFRTPGADVGPGTGPERRPLLNVAHPTDPALLVAGDDPALTGNADITITTALVNDNVRGSVISYTKAGAVDRFDEHYVEFPFDQPLDLSAFGALRFDVLDTQGSNTVRIALLDDDDDVCRIWTPDSDKPVQNEWTTVSVSLNFAKPPLSRSSQDCKADAGATTDGSFDHTRVSKIRLSEYNTGNYRFSGFTLVYEGTSIASPTTVTGGSSATASVAGNTKGRTGVISLVKTGEGAIEQGYAAFSFAAMDLSEHNLLQFEVLDGQGSNNVYVTLTDSAGMSWSAWTPTAEGEQSIRGRWATVGLDLDGATGIDLTQITGIRVAMLNAGTYLFTGFVLFDELRSAPVLSYTGGARALTHGTEVSPAISFVNSGEEIVSCRVMPNLPAGLNLNAATCEISGTPTAAAPQSTYTVVASNGLGSSMATVSITVAQSAPNLGSARLELDAIESQDIDTLVIANGGGDLASCAFVSGATTVSSLSGLSVAPDSGNRNCEVTGAPTSTGTQTITVRATNASGSGDVTVRFMVTPAGAPLLTAPSGAGALVRTVSVALDGTAAAPIIITNANAGASAALAANSCKLVDGALPPADLATQAVNGLGISTVGNACHITGTPTMLGGNALRVRAASSSENSAVLDVVVTVVNPVPVLTSAQTTPLVYTQNQNAPITPIRFSSSGGPITSCAVDPALPDGLDFDSTTCEISGRPVAAAALTEYDVVASNDGGDSAAFKVTITVAPELASRARRLAFDNPASPSAGTVAMAASVANANRDRNVLSLTVTSAAMVAQAYAGFSFASVDASIYDTLSFDVFDATVANALTVTLVDSAGMTWSSATSGMTAMGEWTRLSLDISAAHSAATVDTAQLAGIRVASAVAENYLLSGFVLTQTGIFLDNPAAVTASPSAATVSVVADDAKGARVISYTKAGGGADDAYVVFTLAEATDLSNYVLMEFDVLDTGSNTVRVAFVDDDGDICRAWTDGGSVANVWTTVSLDLAFIHSGTTECTLDSGGTDGAFDDSKINAIRLSEFHNGDYRFSDFAFFRNQTPDLRDLDLSNPAAPTSSRTACATGAEGCATAAVSVIENTIRGKDVISYVKTGNPGVGSEPLNAADTVYATFSFDAVDVSDYTHLQFYTLDMNDASNESNNTIRVGLVDADGKVWQEWSSRAHQTTKGSWEVVAIDITPARGTVDTSRLVAIRLSAWHGGTYLFSDLSFTTSLPN